MNYYGAKDLADGFRTVRKNTIIIAEEIGEEHYGFRATPDTRTVAQTLTHIAVVPQLSEHIHGKRLANLEGFDFFGFFAPLLAQEQSPGTKAHIVGLLRDSGDRGGNGIESLSDDFLGATVAMRKSMTPASNTLSELILAVKAHEKRTRGHPML